MAINLAPSETSIWRIVAAVIQLIQGRSNAVGTVTLRASQTTTTVLAQNCSVDSRPQLFPMTAHAAAVVATTYVKAADVTPGQFIITHASSANIDQTFNWSCFG